MELELPDGTTVEIPIEIRLGRGYPPQTPRAYEVEHHWRKDRTRHVEPDGHLCLFLTGLRQPDMSPPDSLLWFIEEVELFVRQQIILDSLRRFNPVAPFPGPEWPHGDAGFAAAIVEALEDEPEAIRPGLWEAAQRPTAKVGNCPCGSGDTYKACHFPKSKVLRRAILHGALRHVPYESLVQQAQHS